MPFLALGVEHTTAPLQVRERVALDGAALDGAVLDLAAQCGAEVAVLSTCNRIELYMYVEDVMAADAAAIALLAGRDHSIVPYVRRWHDLDAAEHLFRVACGLESQVPGEGQILAQVRATLDSAQRLGTIGTNLHTMVRSAISCGRQARAGTSLGEVNRSLGSEAIRLAHHALGSLEGRAALVIGAGEIGRLVASDLTTQGIGSLYIANRTPSVAADLAARHHGTAITLDDIDELIPRIDLIFSATRANRYILTVDMLAEHRPSRPLYIYDLAIPRDVDPEVGTLPGITLRDLDGLLPADAGPHWSEDIRQIEALIASNLQEFTSWHLTRRVVPVIASLRSHVEAVSRQELKRVGPQLADLTDRERVAVESLTNRLIDKMFHHLVLRLRLAAQTDPKLVDAAEFFFLHGEGGLFAHAATMQPKEREVHH